MIQLLTLMYAVFDIAHSRKISWNGCSVSVGGRYMKSSYNISFVPSPIVASPNPLSPFLHLTLKHVANAMQRGMGAVCLREVGTWRVHMWCRCRWSRQRAICVLFVLFDVINVYNITLTKLISQEWNGIFKTFLYREYNEVLGHLHDFW